MTNKKKKKKKRKTQTAAGKLSMDFKRGEEKKWQVVMK